MKPHSANGSPNNLSDRSGGLNFGIRIRIADLIQRVVSSAAEQIIRFPPNTRELW
jgi:hypothetical protein